MSTSCWSTFLSLRLLQFIGKKPTIHHNNHLCFCAEIWQNGCSSMGSWGHPLSMAKALQWSNFTLHSLSLTSTVKSFSSSLFPLSMSRSSSSKYSYKSLIAVFSAEISRSSYVTPATFVAFLSCCLFFINILASKHFAILITAILWVLQLVANWFCWNGWPNTSVHWCYLAIQANFALHVWSALFGLWCVRIDENGAFKCLNRHWISCCLWLHIEI